MITQCLKINHMKKKYLEECKIIQQNCTYSAEAHHIIAKKNKRLSTWFQVVPAVIATLSGLLVAGSVVPVWFGWLTVISAVITAVANVLNPLKEYYDHLNAAKNFTAMKHDARTLGDVFNLRMDDSSLAVAVENLHQRYGDLIKFVPPTDNDSFEEASARIKDGIHEPDDLK